MTTQRDFKRLVRRRMAKTGESYTAARSVLLRSAPAPQPPFVAASTLQPNQPAAVAAPIDLAKLAGMSDEAVKSKTGCGWANWVFVLDRAGADRWSHRAIASHIKTKYRTPDWWTQMVTVGYERIKGLRVEGQRRGGGFSVNRSRTFPVGVDTLFRACQDGRSRSRWLGRGAIVIHSATPAKYLRGRTPDGRLAAFVFTGKGTGKSQVQVQVEGFPDRAGAEIARAWWGERLDALGALLARR